ncbi:hypothetical protein PPL_05025 [Heterostelium album PN500]|uniref:NAD-dependent epimerase/dehydratase domain-containing protein n=1 Tax=Heterostelium pallidum (strain ATCC 26659 / Pp 5 / PN500) TaxID=670386 RepID=D3B981_HETP5|nr:hypothetical protein PPL_05025 [Heterostelium album PN500]EFA82120.1 hypothetical protein PPL_05025 [Heterostelium album PN500]|eukprot:XP_020434237.1 hypothetical protein PPL_05025 [Heterostelium album PN500]
MDYNNDHNIIFVTGGSGFVGSNLIKRLVDNGYPMVRAMSRSNQSDDTIRKCGGQPIRCSLSDDRSMKNAITGCKTVIHCAAKLETNANTIEELFQDNVKATEQLYNTGLIYSSTDFIVSDQKARDTLSYRNIISYNEGMDELLLE